MQNTLNQTSVMNVVQAVFQACTAYTTTCSVIPYDNTKPENTEGVEMVDCPFTPLATGHIMQVEVNWNGLVSKGANFAFALFHSSSSMAKSAVYVNGAASDINQSSNLVFQESVSALTTQSYSLRVGTSASGKQVFVNGDAASQLFNGSLFVSVTVTELATG